MAKGEAVLKSTAKAASTRTSAAGAGRAPGSTSPPSRRGGRRGRGAPATSGKELESSRAYARLAASAKGCHVGAGPISALVLYLIRFQLGF